MNEYLEQVQHFLMKGFIVVLALFSLISEHPIIYLLGLASGILVQSGVMFLYKKLKDKKYGRIKSQSR